MSTEVTRSDQSTRAEEARSSTSGKLAPHDFPVPRELARWFWSGWPFEGEPALVGEARPHPVCVEETVEDGQLVVRAELPGIDPEKDVEVVVDGDALTIRGERRVSNQDRTSSGYRTEFRYGRFLRRIPLPAGTSVEVVSASYRDGVLEVRMPAPTPKQGERRITVDRG